MPPKSNHQGSRPLPNVGRRENAIRDACRTSAIGPTDARCAWFATSSRIRYPPRPAPVAHEASARKY